MKHAVNCYFGTASPFVEGLDWQLLPPTQRPQDRDPWKAMDGRPSLSGYHLSVLLETDLHRHMLMGLLITILSRYSSVSLK